MLVQVKQCVLCVQFCLLTHFERSELNAKACLNMLPIDCTLAVFHWEISELNDEALWNIPPIWRTLAVFHWERSWLNDVADWNIALVVVTFAMSHLEMSLKINKKLQKHLKNNNVNDVNVTTKIKNINLKLSNHGN